MNKKLCRNEPWFKVPRPSGLRFARVICAVILLSLLQEIVLTIFEHRRFATSQFCHDNGLLRDAGKYGPMHCADHREAGDLRRVSTWIAAITELKWQRVVALIGAVWCF